MDFRQAVIRSLDRLVESEEIDKLIHKHLAATAERIISDALSTYSSYSAEV